MYLYLNIHVKAVNQIYPRLHIFISRLATVFHVRHSVKFIFYIGVLRNLPPRRQYKECIRHKVPLQLLMQRVPQSFSRNLWIILTIVKYGKPPRKRQSIERRCEELQRIIGKKGACERFLPVGMLLCGLVSVSPLSSWQQPEEENRYKRVDRLLEASLVYR